MSKLRFLISGSLLLGQCRVGEVAGRCLHFPVYRVGGMLRSGGSEEIRCTAQAGLGSLKLPTLKILMKWCLSSRLETRTGESFVYASQWVKNPTAKLM